MIAAFRIVALALAIGVCAFGTMACGGDGGMSDDASDAAPFAAGLQLLPDKPELRRHVLIGDLDRLRSAYGDAGMYDDALGGVWLPDALSGARQPLWKTTFGLVLDDVSSYASAGFHPAVVAVAQGDFAPSLIARALLRFGYQRSGGLLAIGSNGEIDASTAAGRLALASLNRIALAPDRLTAASTSALTRSAVSPTTSLALRPEFAAVAAALDPITAAIVLDAELVRPPYGVPTRILPRHSARLVGIGIDDAGPRGRTLKIALVYDDEADAREDAAVIERELASTDVPGLPDARFSDFSTDWDVRQVGRAILLTAPLLPDESAGLWRDLVERGDLAPFVRPAVTQP